jgi:hypothetical protein
MRTLFFLVASLALVGCANRMDSMVAPAYKSKVTPVRLLGITGGGSAVATPAFVGRGYRVVDIPASSTDPLLSAKSKHATYLATVDPVGAEGSWWDGFFDYALRVTEVLSGTIVWSAAAEYGQGGVFINQVKSSRSAMRDMVEEFSKNFPPAD